MKIFIVGNDKVGKSSVAKQLGELLSLKYVIYEAGEWVRQEYGPGDDFSLEYKKQLTAYATDKLRQFPNYSYDYYKAVCGRMTDVIIVGVRNPFDYCKMSDYNSVIIHLPGNSISDFEDGVGIIIEMAKWNEKLLDRKIVYTLNDPLDDLLALAGA